MRRIQIPLAKKFGNARSATLQSLTNLYGEPIESEGRTNWTLYGTPARVLFSTIGGGAVRGQIEALDICYAVVGTRLYSVSTDGTASDLGGIEGADPVDMSFNGTNVCVVAELKSYTYTPSTLTLAEVVDPDFEQATSTASLSNYTFTTVRNSGRFRWSALADATSWDALDFSTAEAESDSLVAIRKSGNELVLLGKETTEWWYITGDTDNLLQRTSTAAATIGCVSRDAAVLVDNALTWVGRDGKAGGISVYRAEGYSPKKISDSDVDILLEAVSDLGDLNAFAYQQQGHLFYVLNNPGEWSVTWDIMTGQWSWRKSGSWSMGALPLGGWDASTFAINNNKQIVGASDGNLYHLQANVLSESGVGIIREVTCPQIHNGGRRQFMHKLQLDIKTGVGLSSGQGSDPVAFVSHSDDGGATWSDPRSANIGATGQYKWRATWNVLGSYRERIFKFRVTDPVEVVILGAWADVTDGAF